MDEKFLIINAIIVNEGRIFEGNVLVKNGFIEEVFSSSESPSSAGEWLDLRIIDGRGKYLFPGLIDASV